MGSHKESRIHFNVISVIRDLHNSTAVALQTGRGKTHSLLVNRNVRQECSQSPTLFNIDSDDMIR